MDSFNFAGINGVTFYAGTIFRETAGTSNLNPHIPSIILATTQVLAAMASGLVVERAGRKTLLLLSSILLFGSTGILGLYFCFGSTISFLHWVPLAALIFFYFSFAIGYGPVTYVIVAEILLEEVRHVMNPVAIAYAWLCMFIVTKSFPILLSSIGIYGIFWMYSGFAVISTLFVALCVPETKGKQLFEIRNFFGDKDLNGEENNAIPDNCSHTEDKV